MARKAEYKVIQRQTESLKDGSKVVRLYEVTKDSNLNHVSSRPLGRAIDQTLSTCYRAPDKRRIVAALQAGEGILVIGETGSGKSTLIKFVEQELVLVGFLIVPVKFGTTKTMMSQIISDIQMPDVPKTVREMQIAVTEFIQKKTIFLFFDDAHRYAIDMRVWMEELYGSGIPILVTATSPPAKDIFIKLPRIELDPLSDRPIREIMIEKAELMNLKLTPGQLSRLQERVGGNPLLAARVIKEQYLGLSDPSPDHTQWLDGTPGLIIALMIFGIVRVVGRATGSETLYLLGSVITVMAFAVRLGVCSLPRGSQKLGR